MTEELFKYSLKFQFFSLLIFQIPSFKAAFSNLDFKKKKREKAKEESKRSRRREERKKRGKEK